MRCTSCCEVSWIISTYIFTLHLSPIGNWDQFRYTRPLIHTNIRCSFRVRLASVCRCYGTSTSRVLMIDAGSLVTSVFAIFLEFYLLLVWYYVALLLLLLLSLLWSRGNQVDNPRFTFFYVALRRHLFTRFTCESLFVCAYFVFVIEFTVPALSIRYVITIFLTVHHSWKFHS